MASTISIFKNPYDNYLHILAMRISFNQGTKTFNMVSTNDVKPKKASELSISICLHHLVIFMISFTLSFFLQFILGEKNELLQQKGNNKL